MLTEKIFHVRNSVEDTKNRLARIGLYRRHLDGVEKAAVTGDGVAEFEFDAGLGVRASIKLAELPSNDPNIKLFRSTRGDLDVTGSLEFIPIKNNLTEVVLTIDYRCRSLFSQMLDQCAGVVDSFLNRQLRCIQSYLDAGVAAPSPRWRSYQQPVQYA